MSKVKILFFTADPLSIPPGGKPRLLLDEEMRDIREKVRAAQYRDSLEFDQRGAVRTDDLLQALSERDAQVVHFSGHGGTQGLVLVGRDGQSPQRVQGEALAQCIRSFPHRDVRLVILNACLSLPQAEAVAEVVGCAIGTRREISDWGAITFSGSFYRAIAFGLSVQVAFDQARAALALNQQDQACLELVVRPGVDPARVILVQPEPAPPPAPDPPLPFAQDLPASSVAGSTDARTEVPVDEPRHDPGRGRRMRRSVAVLSVLAASTGVVLTGAALLNREDEAGARGKTRADTTLSPGASAFTSGLPAPADVAAAKDLYRAGNHDAAFPVFLRAALAGDHEAMAYAGIMYYRGEGTRARLDSAYHWVHLAATGGRDARGMNALGIMYQTGQGADRSLRWARHWYAEAAEKGYAEAMRNLGSLHRDGPEPRYDSARVWYGRAARAGSLDAMVDAGRMHEEGLGGPRDPAEAVRLYREAADAGSPQGMVAMGRIHQDGVGVPQDYGQARAWYLKAVDAGSADAMNNLGVLYQNGWGVPADRDEAIRWYRRAAEAGSTVAAGNLTTLLNAG